jgi:hypothetical protein
MVLNQLFDSRAVGQKMDSRFPSQIKNQAQIDSFGGVVKRTHVTLRVLLVGEILKDGKAIELRFFKRSNCGERLFLKMLSFRVRLEIDAG